MAMRFVWTFLLVLWAGNSPAADGAQILGEIPFEFHDGFIWVNATVAGSGQHLRLLLDSGAQVSVIEEQTAQRMGLGRGRPVTVQGVRGRATGYWPQKIAASAGEVRLPREYLRLDLGALKKACPDSTIDGLLGADFFRDRIVQVDFEARRIRLLGQDPTGTPNQSLPMQASSCGMLVPVTINNSAPQWLRLDTGCASALHWVQGGMNARDSQSRRMAVALSSFSVPVTKTRVVLGTVSFNGVATDLQDREVFPGEQGLLGNGLLSRFQSVTIDAKRGKIFLGPLLRNAAGP